MAIPVTLEDYQNDALDFTKNHERSCLVMPTGSGKTIVALYAAFDFFLKDTEKNNIVFIGPKVAENLFRDELHNQKKKFPPEYELNKALFLSKLITFTDAMFAQTYLKPDKGLVQNKTMNENTMLVIDEAHHLKSPKSNYFTVIARHCGLVGRLLLLTATPVTTRFEDLYTLQFLLALHTVNIDGKYRFGLKMKEGDHDNLSSLITDFKKTRTNDSLLMDLSEKYHYLHTPFYVVDRERVYPNLRKEDQLIKKIKIDETEKDFLVQPSNDWSQFQNKTLVHNDKKSKKYEEVIEKTVELFQQKKRIFLYFPYVDKSNLTVNTITEDLKKKGVTLIFTFSSKMTDIQFEQELHTINDTWPNRALVVVASDVLAESATLKCFDYVVFLGPENVYSHVLQIIGRTIRHTSHTTCSDPEKKYENVQVLMYYSGMDTGRCNRMGLTKNIAYYCMQFMKRQQLARSPVTKYFDQIQNVNKKHVVDILDFQSNK